MKTLFFLSISFLHIFLFSKEIPLELDNRDFFTKICTSTEKSGLNFIDSIYIINLDERPEKWSHVNQLLNEKKLNCTRVSGVNGWKLPNKIYKKLRGRPYKEEMNAGKVGCALSHFSIWEHALNLSEEIVWIMEDDIEFFGSPILLEEYIESLNQIDPEWDILYTDRSTRLRDGSYRIESTRIDKSFEDENSIFTKVLFRHGTYSMLISNRGLKKLYECLVSQKIWAPIDDTIHLIPGLRQYCLKFPLITHCTLNRISDTDSCNFE